MNICALWKECMYPQPGRGGTPILGHGREVPQWWPSFLRFLIQLGALFSILKPLKQSGSIWLTPHCVDIQSNWPPFSQFPIQLTPFFWTLSDPICPFFKPVLSLPTKIFDEYSPPPQSATQLNALHFTDTGKKIKLIVSVVKCNAQFTQVIWSRNLPIDGTVPVMYKELSNFLNRWTAEM